MQSITSPGDCGMVAVIGLNLELIQRICEEVNNEFLLNGPETQFPKIVELPISIPISRQFYQGRKKR